MALSWLGWFVLGFALAQVVSAQAAGVPAEDSGPAADNEIATNATILIGEPEGSPLVGAALEQATEEVASHLRCPVCQGLSVADSHTDTAIAMMDEARKLLAAGFTQEQSLLYFEQSYGEFIRLAPKAEGFNLVVWIAPVAVILMGLLIIGLRLRGRSKSSPMDASGDGSGLEDLSLADPELAEYLVQVRREVATATKGGGAAVEEEVVENDEGDDE